jgi:hypothetical protein
MSARDTPKPENIDSTQQAKHEQTDIQLVADLLTENGIDTTEVHQKNPPHLEIRLKKPEVAKIQALIHEAETEHQYRIITPRNTTALRSWPTDKSETEQKRTVFITPDEGLSFTPEQKDMLRAGHL